MSASGDREPRPVPPAVANRPGHCLREPGARLLLIVLSIVLFAASVRVLAKWRWQGRRFDEVYELLYPATTLGFNYLEFGFVRRGLGGTLVHLTGLSQVGGSIAFHLLWAAVLAGVASVFIVRVSAESRLRIVYASTFAVFMLFWAEDVARTDIAITALIGMAALALLAGRPVVAALCLVAGLGIHENGFIFGLPLVLLLLADRRRFAAVSRRSLLAAIGLIVVFGAAYAAIDRLPHADDATMAATIRARLPSSVLVERALYFALAGTRGVRTALCQNWVNPNYALQVACGLLVIAAVVFILAGTHAPAWKRALAVSLPPYAFLCLVANDTARWAMLASVNAWFVCCADASLHEVSRQRSRVAMLVAVATLLVFTHPRRPLQVPMWVFSPSPFIEALSMRLGGPTTPLPDAILARCDPDWTQVVRPTRAR
jgi:hypothetical protein